MEQKSAEFLGKTIHILKSIDRYLIDAPPGTREIWIHPSFSLVVTKRVENHNIRMYQRGGAWTAQSPTVVDGVKKIVMAQDALYTLSQKGRVYKTSNNRLVVKVWSKEAALLRMLKMVYGGNYYRHGSGLTWVCSKKAVLRSIYMDLIVHQLDMKGIELLKEYFS